MTAPAEGGAIEDSYVNVPGNHYDKYNELGLKFDPAKNATYQIVSTEGYQSTGSSDITVAEIVVASGTTSTVAPACTTDARDKPLAGSS